jgi:hypothetical protein
MHSMLVNAYLCLLLVFMREVSSSGVDVMRNSLAVLGGMQLVQLGSLSLLVYIATVWLEGGAIKTLQDILKQLVAGVPARLGVHVRVWRGIVHVTHGLHVLLAVAWRASLLCSAHRPVP